ncbi:MAG TPA: Arm DNA-binding domain-containing protein [Sphingobacterium sp.]|jgi:hypothetical protein|nr:Arm DNA-binding domain-containing protein [Sphingobacterium sp.]
MKTQNCTFEVIFYLKKQKTTAQGKAPIYARVTVNGKRTEISVKRSVAVSGWDAKKGLAKGSREETAELNRFLARFKAKSLMPTKNWYCREVQLTRRSSANG